MKSSYQIKIDSKGYKFLIVNGILTVDSMDDIKSEDFDAIFVDDFGQTHYELSYQLQLMSPFQSLKCHLKPRFLASTLKNRVLHLLPLIDGFAKTYDEKGVADKMEPILEQLTKIETFKISEVKKNSFMYFLKLCKYAISRGMFEFTISMEEAYAQGHTALYVGKQNNIAENLNDDFARFNHVLLELGYAKRKKFIDRIHACPHCMKSHLYYMEVCPKCDSSNLKEEAVLHHFRCANISPESTYAYDGDLRCPKCKQILRHIGVDYDRPSNIYTCKDCNNTFLHTRMKVYCPSCQKISRPSELHPYDVYLYEYTFEGIQALSSNDAIIAVSKDLWGGYSSFDAFLSQIRLFSYSRIKEEVIYVNRARVVGPSVNKETIMQIMGELQKRYHYNNISYKGDHIFMATKAPASMEDELWMQTEMEYEEMLRIIDLKYSGISFEGQCYLRQEKDEKVEKFIERIAKVNC